MDLIRLKSFLMLADTLHFGRAAARLGIAQPHLSRRILDLEVDIGVQLFNGSQPRVELTPAGQALRVRAARVLKEIDNAAEEARQIAAGVAGRLRIGFIHSSSYSVLPAILRRLRILRPTVVLDLAEMTMLEQVKALRTGDIDVAVMRTLGDCRDIVFETIVGEPFCLAVASDHRFARRRRIPMRELSGQPVIMFPRETSPLFNLRITAAFERAGVTPMIVQEATQIHTVLGLVSAGIGIAVVPHSAHRLPRVNTVLVDLVDPPEPTDVCLSWMKATSLPLLEPLRNAAKEAAVLKWIPEIGPID
jgi:DNA-binding transcriptional LysR family regulator